MRRYPIEIKTYEPRRRVATDPTKFKNLESMGSSLNGIDSFPPEYRDYIAYMNQHPTRHPSYNPKMMDKQHLEEVAKRGQIGYVYMEKDYDGDKKKDVLVWGKKGLKAFNGYTLKPAKWKPDRDFYVANQDVKIPYGKGNAGKLRQMSQEYNDANYGVPQANYNRYGVMENWDAYKGTRDRLYKSTMNERGQTYDYGVKRKPKARSLRSIYSEIVLDPFIKAIKEIQGRVENRFSFTLKEYNALVSELFANFLLESPRYFKFGDQESMYNYLTGNLKILNTDSAPEIKRKNAIKAKMSKTLNIEREYILNALFESAETERANALQLLRSNVPKQILEADQFDGLVDKYVNIIMRNYAPVMQQIAQQAEQEQSLQEQMEALEPLE